MMETLAASPHVAIPSYDVFGAKLTPMTREDILALIAEHIAERKQCVVASQNLHGLKVLQEEEHFRALHALPQTYVHLDGMPLVALCRLAGIDARGRHRVTLLDLIWPMMELAAAEGWRVYAVGSEPAVLARGLAVIRERYPNLQIAGHHGFFALDDSAANRALLDELRGFDPQLVLVGMGMGRQERWILANLEALHPASICTVGACLEYLAGAVQTPPRWLGRAGLEWLFRLITDPRRFAHRYLIEPWTVLARVASHSIGRRR
jgi:N-acetylglucosaminyldiphosphoundecaprenol N-acetyl-beta-D-mannosaminyltransferase